MTWLLHSKRFRVNLKKWLCMYVGVILTFTTVVTYSRYVSTFTASSTARVAKFKVDIYCEDGIRIGKCSRDTYSRYQPITYRFNLERDLEVKTNLRVSIMIDKNFELERVEDVIHGQLFFDKENSLGSTSPSSEGGYNIFVIDRMITPSVKDNSIYEVKVSYHGDGSDIDTAIDYENAVQVGFVATQVKE